MSFKREGDDAALLNSLQHRRVAEILSSNIPDSEASLLSNGRLTCLICSYRPVFDTITTLSVHRTGKKHIHELSKYLARKAELELQAVKGTQQTHVYAGLTTKESAAGQPLRRTTPCKSRRFCHDRKPTLEAATPATNVLISPPESAVPSPAAQVRRYLKSIERSRPLHKTLEHSREGGGGSQGAEEPMDQQQTSALGQGEEPREKPDPPQPFVGPREDFTARSGYRLGKNGEWERDPDAEFDSDDEDL